MSEFKVISAIMRGRWLLDDTFIESHIPLIANVLKGGRYSYKDDEEYSQKSAISADGTVRYDRYRGFSEAPSGSIAKILLRGPVMHYGWCDDGTNELNEQFNAAYNSPNIIGVLLDTDSPGGQVDGTESLAETIYTAPKPVVGFGNNGYIASAALWIATACKELYVDGPLTMIGSKGVYQRLYDFREAFKMAGVDIIDVYARQSTDKNKVYIDALNKKTDALKDELDYINDKFTAVIKKHRNGKLTSDDWLTGKLYYADEAHKIGLIDGYKTKAQAIERIRELSKTKGSISPKTISSQKSISMNFPNIEALAGKTEISQEDLDKANGDLTVAGITGHTIVAESFISDAAQATADLKEANTKLADLQNQLTASQSKVTKLETSNATLKDVIAGRAKEPSGAMTDKESGKKSEIEDQNNEPLPVSAHQKWANEVV
ncbi:MULTISPECIES: S49 family peptidase [Olivibacter]|uniref:S49 family peptidase n=1 Tax=Olivibacter jilunii TaxID=985016 RepID=A0ABW6AW18_9SPHI